MFCIKSNTKDALTNSTHPRPCVQKWRLCQIKHRCSTKYCLTQRWKIVLDDHICIHDIIRTKIPILNMWWTLDNFYWYHIMIIVKEIFAYIFHGMLTHAHSQYYLLFIFIDYQEHWFLVWGSFDGSHPSLSYDNVYLLFCTSRWFIHIHKSLSLYFSLFFNFGFFLLLNGLPLFLLDSWVGFVPSLWACQLIYSIPLFLDKNLMELVGDFFDVCVYGLNMWIMD